MGGGGGSEPRTGIIYVYIMIFEGDTTVITCNQLRKTHKLLLVGFLEL